MKKSRNILRKAIVLAASLCLIFASLGTVYAMNLFGLKELILGNDSKVLVTTTEKDGTVVETEIPSATIALQGYTDRNEYKAAAEWNAFLDSYDQDMSLLQEVGNGPTGLDKKYDLYGVYTQEMADKLDEITSKYELKLHTAMEIYSNNEELFQSAGVGDFLGTVNKAAGGYIYEDGTFQYDGSVVLGKGKVLEYQFRNCKKGIFDEVTLNIGNVEEYKEWSYETTSGITVTIANSPNKSILNADLENSFVSINVLPELSTDEVTAADLEDFADSIDFSKINVDIQPQLSTGDNTQAD